MDQFQIVRAVVTLTYFVGTLAFIVVVWSLPGRVARDRSEICLQVDNGLSCGHVQTRLPQFMNEALVPTLEELEQREQPETVSAVYLKSDLTNNPDRLRPAARYLGASVDFKPSNSSDQPPLVTLKAWQRHDPSSSVTGFERYGVTFHDGRIIVPLGGVYHVYSILDFYEEFDRLYDLGDYPDNPNKRDIEHGIFRFNIKDGEEKKLVSSIQPHQVPYHRAFNLYSSYVSLMVELRAGDELSVKVNHPGYMSDTKSNVFGLTML